MGNPKAKGKKNWEKGKDERDKARKGKTCVWIFSASDRCVFKRRSNNA